MVADVAIRQVQSKHSHTHGREPDRPWMGIFPLRWEVGH